MGRETGEKEQRQYQAFHYDSLFGPAGMAIHKRRKNVNPVFYGEQPISLQLYIKFRQGSIKRRRFSRGRRL
jgi:hypothetical protein